MTYTPIVHFQSKDLVFAPNFVSELNVGFGFKKVKFRLCLQRLGSPNFLSELVLLTLVYG